MPTTATPRTDSQTMIVTLESGETVECVHSSLARELESDLASSSDHLSRIRSSMKAFCLAKGQHNVQIAAARMFELVGLPSEYPKAHLTQPPSVPRSA